MWSLIRAVVAASGDQGPGGADQGPWRRQQEQRGLAAALTPEQVAQLAMQQLTQQQQAMQQLQQEHAAFQLQQQQVMQQQQQQAMLQLQQQAFQQGVEWQQSQQSMQCPPALVESIVTAIAQHQDSDLDHGSNHGRKPGGKQRKAWFEKLRILKEAKRQLKKKPGDCASSSWVKRNYPKPQKHWDWDEEDDEGDEDEDYGPPDPWHTNGKDSWWEWRDWHDQAAAA